MPRRSRSEFESRWRPTRSFLRLELPGFHRIVPPTVGPMAARVSCSAASESLLARSPVEPAARWRSFRAGAPFRRRAVWCSNGDHAYPRGTRTLSRDHRGRPVDLVASLGLSIAELALPLPGLLH